VWSYSHINKWYGHVIAKGALNHNSSIYREVTGTGIHTVGLVPTVKSATALNKFLAMLLKENDDL